MLANAAAAAKSAATRSADEVLTEINAARTDPASYASKVAATLTQYEGRQLKRAGRAPVQTQEGVGAVNEAVAFLKACKPLPPLQQVSAGMCAAACDHVADLGRSGGTGHDGSDGSTPFDRLLRHGRWSGNAAENIAFGAGISARDRVVQLIVDDGVASRGHRANIFNESFRVLGVAEGSHPKFGALQVQTFASAYSEGSSATSAARAAAKPVASKQPAAASAPLAPRAHANMATLKAPPGGRVEVKTSVVTSGRKKTTTTTTITTAADGSTSTRVETVEEIVG